MTIPSPAKLISNPLPFKHKMITPIKARSNDPTDNLVSLSYKKRT